MMRKLGLTLMVLVSLTLGAPSLDAITFQPKSFDELADEAEQIFIGTVRDATSRRTDKGAIVTDYMFGDLEVIKGDAPEPHTSITMLGGTVGNESMTIAGAPDFVIGVRYLVFVAGNGSVIFPVVGGHQGIFQVRPDAQTGGSNVYAYGGRPIIGLPASKGTLSNRGVGSSASGGGGSATPTAVSTEAFVRAIRRVLER
jgi:hypothetical protein